MKKRLLFPLGLLFPLVLTSCGSGAPQPDPTYDYSYFNGICALSGEFNNGVDRGLTNEWTASRVKALKAKSCRIWIAMSGLFSVGEEDDLTINQIYYNVMLDHIEKLKEAGVENFLLMFTAFVYPTGYSTSTGYVVPNPKEEYDYYIRFLNLNAEAAKQIITMFPEIKNYEPGNEPDPEFPGCIHKNGYVYGGNEYINKDFCYLPEEKVSIINDLCWYVRRAVKSVDSKAKVVYPGLTNQIDLTNFVDLVYKKIESHTLPAGQQYSDTNPDNYFDVLNWHPYPNTRQVNGTVIDWTKWVNDNKAVYDVVKKHNDNGKEVYFSEIGWTDFGTSSESTLNQIANNYTTAFRYIKEEMPWVTVVFPFRLTNLKYQALDQTGGEENFGLFYHPDDDLHHGSPKPAADAVAKIYNGENYDLDAHL